MAAMLTLKLTKFRNPRNPNLSHLFSSSSSNFNSNNNNNDNDENNSSPNQSPPSLSSHFDNIKSSLKNTTTQNRKFTEPQSPVPSKTASSEEIRKNLFQFRSKTSPPSSLPVNTTPSNTVSFQELYKRNVIGKGGEDMGTSSSSSNVGGGGGRQWFDSIRESLKSMKSANVRERNDGDSGKVLNPYSLKQFQDSLTMKPGDIGTKKGGGDGTSVPSMLRKVNDSVSRTTAVSGSRTTEFVKTYSHTELGDKLKQLRPTDVKGKNWFSLEELNQRLKKLRENEEKELSVNIGGVSVKELRESLNYCLQTTEEKNKKATLQKLDIMGHLGGTPNYMLRPPKEQLVEKFFHPDNMSSAEKLKLELKKVRDEFKMSESDCGSSPVQVAQLTTKIKHLSSVLHKKDKHSRKGLQEMVQRRKKLLRYLRRTDWESFCFCLDKLGLRDNPDYKN